MDKTTIQLSQSTLERLKSFKRYDRESYEEIVNNLADEAEEELSVEEIEDIQEALEQVKKGDLYSIEEVAKELGVKL